MWSNTLTGSPKGTYAEGSAQVGNFHIDRVYDGVALYRIANESGGISDILSVGHTSKSVLCELMHAYLRGIELGKAL